MLAFYTMFTARKLNCSSEMFLWHTSFLYLLFCITFFPSPNFPTLTAFLILPASFSSLLSFILPFILGCSIWIQEITSGLFLLIYFFHCWARRYSGHCANTAVKRNRFMSVNIYFWCLNSIGRGDCAGEAVLPNPPQHSSFTYSKWVWHAKEQNTALWCCGSLLCLHWPYQ